MHEPQIRVQLLLALQRALLGEVPPALRAVTCGWEGTDIRLQFLFDGAVSKEDEESARAVGAELIADFSEGWTIDEDIRRLDYPADRRSPALSFWAYARKESAG